MSRDIFSKVLNHILWILALLACVFKGKRLVFGKIKMSLHTGGWGRGGFEPVFPNDTWGRGGLKSAKKVSRIIWMAPYNKMIVINGSPNCVFFCFVGYQLPNVENHWFWRTFYKHNFWRFPFRSNNKNMNYIYKKALSSTSMQKSFL